MIDLEVLENRITLYPTVTDGVRLHVCDNLVELEVNEAFIDPAGADYYTGAYEVDPIFSPVVLATKDKVMSDDVTVKAIRVSTTTNPQGGNTVFIGGIYG